MRRLLLTLLLLPSLAMASPFQEVSKDEALYRRVKDLSRFGILDEADRVRLDSGIPTTRLELAAAVQKASENLEASSAAPSPVAEPAGEAAPSSPPSAVPGPNPQATREVAALLKALRRESEYLKRRLARDQQILGLVDRSQEGLKADRRRVEKAQGKSNRNNSNPNVSANSEFHFDTISLRGLRSHNVATGETALNVRVWADLGGKAQLSSGFNGVLPMDSTASSPASLGFFSPRVDVTLEGRAGKWDLHFMDTAYDSITSVGELTRSGGGGMRRYEDPYNIKAYSSDKLGKIWGDYVRSIGFVEAKDTLASGGSTGESVFDGIVLRGSEIPGIRQARLTLMLGRDEADRFEYTAMVTHPFWRGKGSGRLSAIFAQDQPGVAASPDLDFRNYAAGAGLDLNPVYLSVDGALSRYDTRFDNRPDLDPGVPKDHAFHGSASLYPFSLHYVSIGPEYSNTRAKVTVESLRFHRYGEEEANYAGQVLDAETLVSNRKGVRANLGWDGRRTGFLRDLLPRFTDFMTINSNVSVQNEDISAITSGAGVMGQAVSMGGAPVVVAGSPLTVYTRHTLYVPRSVDFYYPDWSGIWGNWLYAGWDGNPAQSVRQAFIDNVRSAGGGAPDLYFSRYTSRSTSEMFALVDPADGRDILNRKTYRFIDFTDKIQVNRLMGFTRALYVGIYGGLAQVATLDRGLGETVPGGTFLPSGRRLFERRVGDVAVFVGDVLRNVHLTAHTAAEKWRSDYTAPRLDSLTRVWGAGFGWDVPWGGSKFEARYNRVIYTSATVPANNYQGDQVMGVLKMLF